MHQVKRSALMPYSAAQMFAVVDDVARYAEFLPWCQASDVLEDRDDVMVACLSISGGGVRQSFTTRNVRQPPGQIDMVLIKGPFSTLRGQWLFTQLGADGCKVAMNLSFDFDNRLMNKTVGKVFEVAADKLVDAFCSRADVLYAG